jgi:hyaluronan synthase
MYFLPIIIFLVIITPLILQYIFHWEILDFYGIYGIYLSTYLIIQFIFAILNNRHYRQKSLTQNALADKVPLTKETNSKINVMVVGYREDPEYFKMCLESLKLICINCTNLNKLYIIIDGDDYEDKYMIDIFTNTFSDTNLRYTHIFNTNNELHNYLNIINENDVICISQKNGGKRNAMFTGFQLSILENTQLDKSKKINTIFCTDSDTVVDLNCIEELEKLFQDKSIGAAVGNLSIYNKYDSIISFLSYNRYWFAFNLERAYRSFNKNVICVSGPIGMYRLSSLEQIILPWKEQKFLGKLCTYGDDRHLTNKILELKQKVVYTPSAQASTETPTSLFRFFLQQSRWNKSFFREFFWTKNLLSDHSIFMTIDLIYSLVFPFMIIGYLLYILFKGTVFQLGIYLIIVFCIGLIKSVYGVINSNNYEYIFYFLYTLVYISLIIPAKLWSLININDNSWGTSSRKKIINNISFNVIVPILWNLILVIGFVFNIYRGFINKTSFNEYLYVIVPLIIWIFSFLLMSFYVYTNKSNKNKSNKNKIRKLSKNVLQQDKID